MNRQQTVLIVDDEKSNRDLLTELLQPDCRIILAKNGQQALERVADQAHDLILLDVMMPDMDGHQSSRSSSTTTTRAKFRPFSFRRSTVPLTKNADWTSAPSITSPNPSSRGSSANAYATICYRCISDTSWRNWR